MINLKQNFIFCHNEKTAGTSINLELRQLPQNYYIDTDMFELVESDGHRIELNPFDWHTGIHYRNMHTRMATYDHILDLNNFWCFGFVRQPLTRYLSLYLQQLKVVLDIPEIPDPRKILEVPHLLANVTPTISKKLNIPEGKYEFSFDWFMRTYIPSAGGSQISQFCDTEKNVLLDFVGRYENLNHDWEIVCDKLHIPHRPLLKINKTGSGVKDDLVELFYTKDLKEFVYDHYSDEFEVFDYEKG
tara:strand:+ start:130 stop:864 length:735 start_codon:yes stop_codon:yes gene_type:complete